MGYSTPFSGNANHVLELVVAQTAINTLTNTTTVTCRLQIDPPSNSVSWSLISADNSYSMTFQGQTYTGNFTFDYRTDRSTDIIKSTVTKTITHDAAGNGTATTYGRCDTVVLGDAVTGTSGNPNELTLTKLPGTPTAAPTLTRNDAGTTVTVLSATSGTTATITDYEYQQSTDNSTWGAATSMGVDATIDVTSLTATQTYWYQTRVRTADGPGPWSASRNTLGAPATITATRTGRNVAVTAGNATGDTITGYFVQYSTNSGSTWSTAETMTSQAYTYNSLTPGLTYLFRVYAASASGNSGKTVSAGVFVSAGGKRWTGSAWDYGVTAKRWDGSAWVDLTTAKRWNGTSWVDLS
jgi:hypothetical protein